MKSLNFNNIKKTYLTITLADENETTLLIGTPTKSIMTELIGLKTALEEFESDNTNTDALDDLYYACAKVMSRNKGGIKITKEYLEDLFDFEDILTFFNAYMEFVTELGNAKN